MRSDIRVILIFALYPLREKFWLVRVKLAYMLIYNVNLVKIFNILYIINKKKKRLENFQKN